MITREQITEAIEGFYITTPRRPAHELVDVIAGLIESDPVHEAARELLAPTDETFYGTEAQQEAAADALDRLRAALADERGGKP